jgi:hypothetical protein
MVNKISGGSPKGRLNTSEDMADGFGGLFFDLIPAEISLKLQNNSHFLQA